MWKPKTPARMRARSMALQKRKAMSRVGRVTSRVCSPACMMGRPRESSGRSDKTVSPSYDDGFDRRNFLSSVSGHSMDQMTILFWYFVLISKCLIAYSGLYDPLARDML